MLSLTFLLLYFFLFMGLSCSQLHMHTYYLPLYIYIYISRQSKHKEDTTATHPILLNELELEVYSSLSHAFSLPCVTMCSPSFFIIIHHFFFLHAYLSLLNIHLLSFSFFFFFYAFRLTLSPFSIYHPMSEEVSAAISTPMEGCFDGADIMSEAMATASTTTQGGLAETPIPSPKLGPVEESAQTERVGSASPTTPPIISTSDPFGALS